MPQKKTPVYDNASITSLKGADRVRKRPAVIFGSDGIEGCEHSVFEILSNSVDEAREGYGDRIYITVTRDGIISIEDEGRGVPLDYNEKEGKYNWELVYCELYAGGKYNNNDGAANYKYSLGLNGLGAASTQYSSEFMEVRSYRGGEMLEMHFKKGKPDGELMRTKLSRKDKQHGTVVTWRPDLEVFTDTAIPREFYETMLERQAISNKGISFIFRFQRADGEFDERTYHYANGIADYVTALAGESSITPPVFWQMEARGRDRADKPEYNFKAEIAFCFSNEVSKTEYYHNASFLEHGGSPDSATKTAFSSAIDKYIKATGKYNKNESKIGFSDIEDSLFIVINSFSTLVSYANQTKKAITNEFIKEALTNYIKHALEVYFAEKPAEADKIAAQVLINKRSRETAEKTRVDIKKKLTSGSGDVSNRVEKFVSCRSKDPTKREVYIVEGDSAMGSCIQGRDAEFQAIIPVRGKTLNCLKCGYDKIFKSEIIVDLLKVIGCGAEIQGKSKSAQNTFDLSLLKWSKIIICTDADEDGFQIRTLLLTLFYRLLPTLIKEGKVYIAESPLFEINCGKETYFAYNEQEKTQILDALKGKKYTIQRSKGLGENEPEMMWQTTMNPATRRLIQVSPTDAEKTAYIFETLLGDDLPERKDFIRRNGKFYLKDADI